MNDFLTCGNHLLSCENNLLTCGNDFLTCGNELSAWGNGLLTCNNELLTCGHNFLSHGNEIKKMLTIKNAKKTVLCPFLGSVVFDHFTKIVTNSCKKNNISHTQLPCGIKTSYSMEKNFGKT